MRYFDENFQYATGDSPVRCQAKLEQAEAIYDYKLMHQRRKLNTCDHLLVSRYARVSTRERPVIRRFMLLD